MRNDTPISFKQATFVVAWLYQIFTTIVSLGWLVVCLLPVAMSFDSGYHWKMILFDIVAMFGPIFILGLTNWFCWHSYRKERYATAFAVMIVMVVLIGLLILGVVY